MKKLAFAVCLGMLSISLFGQLPKTLSFQGYLTNADGEPITNSALEVSFSLYTQKTGGSLVWGPETHEVNVQKGIFNTILGASQITAVPLDFGGSLTFDQKYFLEIVINPGGTPETLTRIELTSSMFSLSTLNATNITSGTLSGALLDEVDASILSGSVAIANGGTGAADATSARTNLGLAIGSDVQAYDADLADLADGVLTGSKVGTGIDAANITTNALAVTNGGTGAATATAARDNLGLTIGADVQAYDADLTTYAGITPGTDIQTFLGSVNNSTARSNLGLTIGTDVQAFDTDLTTFAGISPSINIQELLSSADYDAARTNLGLAIGSDVQAYDADLTSFGTITPSANILDFLGSANYLTARNKLGLLVGTDVQAYDADLTTYAGITPSTDVQTLLSSANNTAIRSNIGLGSIAAQNANSVAITGGSIGGITDLAVADGGTGASNAAGARTNLGLEIGTNVQAADADLADLADGSLTGTKVSPNFGSQNIATTGALGVGGFTTLGDDASAPAIKMIKYTGTTSSSQGGEALIAHGLTTSKILSVSVIVEASSTFQVHPGYTNNAGYQFNWYLTGTQIRIWNTSANSANILSKPIRILVTYEE
ncbi:MAG: hypothetical protein RLO17_07725 [Cyclobacteriaceae bacterium]